MRLLFSALLTVLAALVAYRIYQVLQRPLPDDVVNPSQLRWIDELGRIANILETSSKAIGFNPATKPVKSLVDIGFSLVLNPTFWRKAADNIKVANAVYGNVPVITFTPGELASLTSPRPVMVYFHGGGWTWFSAGSYNVPLRTLASKTQFVIVAVDYRTAPQAAFPAAYDDCLAVTKHVVDNAKKLNYRSDLIIVAGDGSGGNLAASVAIEMKQKIAMQLLISPALQILNLGTPSYQDMNDVLPGVTNPRREITHWLNYANLDQEPGFIDDMLNNVHASKHLHELYKDFFNSKKRIPAHMNVSERHTLPHVRTKHGTAYKLDKFVTDVRFSPMMVKNTKGIPNAYFISCHYDVLRDEAIMYGHRLLESGVKVKFRHYPSAFHGFVLFAGSSFWKFPVSDKAVNELVDFLQFQYFNVRKERTE
ncbi:arylacetamide deacetylase-like [Haliotis rubra]|uniref:arylacetamide deacetylase-like n=1 Tax=Haliotis rubra TaxID=36100 RepID=UPI001EE55F9C|nr:arylacetamide deacetylase-like [Haliotis rubra]